MARTRKRKSALGSIKVKSGGKTKTFKKVGCSTTKTVAKARAKALRAKGFTARVVDKCVFKGPKSKVRKKRR